MSAVVVTERELAEDAQAELEQIETTQEVRVRGRELLKAVTGLENEIARLKGRLADGEIAGHDAINAVEDILTQKDRIRDQQYALVAAALGWTYSPQQVRVWCERAVEMGAGHPEFNAGLLDDLVNIRKVPNAPYRECIERRVAEHRAAGSELFDTQSTNTRYASHNWLAECAEAVSGGDTRLLAKQLGMTVRNGSNVSLFITYEMASILALTLGMKPRDAGI